MVKYVDKNVWVEQVLMPDESTPILGGTPDWDENNMLAGWSNIPAAQLADRTRFLKEKVEWLGTGGIDALEKDNNLSDLQDVEQAKLNLGLNLVDNVPDADKPVSTATQTALNTKVDKEAGKGLSDENYTLAEKNKLGGVQAGAQVNSVTSVSGKTGVVTLNKTDVGLSDVDNTSDSNKPVSTPQQTALNLKLNADANAVSASKLVTPRTISLSGDASGSVSFDGSDNAVIVVEVVDDSHNHVISNVDGLQTALDEKVDKEAGKGLSSNDFTTAEKNKLTGIESGANAYTHPANHPASIITQNASNRFVTDADKATWNAKQAALVSGTNIKTINGESLLGGGNLVVAGGGGYGGGPTLQGDTAPYANDTKTYQITNFNSFSSYTVSASAGTANINGDTITYTAPPTGGNVSLTLTVDGQPTVFTIDVQSIDVQSIDYIPTPTPTPENFGDPLEGGFYAGMIWNQLAQSATSMTIATGSKTFSVPSMLVAPIVYQGQTVEVRSRANPTNKFVGTVTSANGDNLTINVTDTTGSGTFSDWSIMSRYRVIVAPKSSGEHAGIKLKDVNTALPTACQTLTEGFAATQAMRDADTSTVYPAAHWARNLDIGGRTDWYIPARDELELCWRNLKPVTAANHTLVDRPTVQTFDYKNNGSYGDTAATNGTNNNSAPVGAAYTASIPGQATAAAFRTGGAEAYEFGAPMYWSSSEYRDSRAWMQRWFTSLPGAQDFDVKTFARSMRAVRRSII